MISSLLLSVMTGAVVMASMRAQDTFEQSSATGDLNARAARAIHRIARELMGARWTNLTPAPVLPFGSSSLEYEWAADTIAGAVTWSPRRQIALDFENGELDNGLDDNGNGLIDEQVLVLVDNPGLANERRTVLVKGVSELLEGETTNAADDNGNGLIDEAGLSFSDVDGRLVIRLSLQKVTPDGRVMTRTQQLSLVLRNRG